MPILPHMTSDHCSFILVNMTAVAAACVIGVPANALAQDRFPSRPMTIVVPAGPGSTADIGVRQLAAKLQPRFGQPVLVENKAGANAVIGTAYVAKARADGYTIMYGSASPLAAAPGMVKALPYDPIRDFSGITLTSEQSLALLTRGELKNLTFPQFIERMHGNPQAFPIAGSSAFAQVLTKMMTDAARLAHIYVPYVDAGRMMNDLWGGRVSSALVTITIATPTLKSGQGHILALASPERLPGFPNTPAMQETLPGVHLVGWSGYFAPGRTPRPIVTALYTLISEVNKDPDVTKRNEEGGRSLFLTPEETDAYLKKEVLRWAAMLKAASIEPE